MKTYINILSFFFCLGITAQTINIPDQNFEQGLIDLGIDSDQIINGQVLISDITSVLSLDLSNRNITDLSGIEAFGSLKILDVSDAVLDLSQVDSLEELYMDSGGDAITLNVEEVILTNNPSLQVIQAIDVWKLKKINLKGSDTQLNDLLVNVEKYGEESDSSVCFEVTNPLDAQNQQGIYSNWSISGSSNFSGDCNLRVNDFNKLDVSLYPNPVKDAFRIKTSEEIESIYVFSIKGKEVAHFASQQAYDISNLSTGVYFINVKSNRGESVQRIIKR
ncbi:T9SS type A sorting domain-containing protein [Mesonia aestuariivivens]|uniref:T9SS type A sorting domain-containing protein n=1 Tax=Mesonia aestuariivivens TaxID=2796128 RepID=A0ABS6VZE0_9FLAO|nr:T9SS type A sorting domain-containing protein [Mesonia aestuariivivens]MBW2960960.1 T9SS type A sorting domain-containing protein [Mesonia aestuariivivens]